MLENLSKEKGKRLMAYAALNLFALFLIYLLRDFISPFLGALIFFVLFKGFMEKLVKKGWNPAWAALVIILLSFIIILIPILSLSYMLYSKVVEAMNDPESVFGIVKILDAKIFSITGVKILSDDTLNNIKAEAGNLITSFVGELVYTLGNIGIMYFILYYLLIMRKEFQKEMNNILPFEIENIRILSHELESQTLSNAIGVPLIGIIQGAAAGLGYWIFGVDEPIFWGAVTAFCSLLPLIGTTLVWAPASILLIANGNMWQGFALIVYGFIVIINLDNVARFAIQKKFADVHPIITVFGVVIGIDLFGLPGLIFGPLMMSYFLILVKMYRKVYHVKLDKGEN
jgi:predicted PurR-regulated permease PerM